MPDVDRAFCRKAAAECIELARVTTALEFKETLLQRAAEWLKLAYSKTDAEFIHLLDQFNGEQLRFRAPPPVQRQPMQQQRRQQQQKKPDDQT